jgi:hypothetical protein
LHNADNSYDSNIYNSAKNWKFKISASVCAMRQEWPSASKPIFRISGQQQTYPWESNYNILKIIINIIQYLTVNVQHYNPNNHNFYMGAKKG